MVSHRPDMFTLVIDGVFMLLTYWKAVLALFVMFSAFGLMVLRLIGSQEEDLIRVGFTSLGIGAALTSLVTYALVAAAYFWQDLLIPGAFLILVIAAFMLLREIWMNNNKINNWSVFLLVFITLMGFLFLRLAFLRYILLPPHSDSPVHYQVVSDLLNRQSEGLSGISLSNILQRYYHFGFHSLAAWLAITANIPVENAISLLGQVFLYIAPVCIFALIYSVTRDTISAVFASLLAAFGWTMPAFAVNWGKFPALSALAVAPAILAYTVTLKHSDTRKLKVIIWFALLFLSITLMHSRMLVVLLLALLAYFIIKSIDVGKELPWSQSIRLAVLGAVALLPLYGIFRDFYGSISTFVALLVLLPFAIRRYTKLSIGTIVFTFFLWIALASQITFGGKTQPLLDEQFVAMTLFIPLSLIAGTGLASVMRTIRFKGINQWIIVSLLAGLLVLNVQTRFFYPDPCCNYFSLDDQIAFEWIRENTSTQALFLISAAKSQFQTIGTDSGIWIEALTQRPANKLPYDTDLSSTDEIIMLCQTGATDIYLYSGGREFSFRTDQADSERMHMVFSSGDTVIFKITDCRSSHSFFPATQPKLTKNVV